MNQAYTDEANLISSSGAWLWLIEIALSGYSTLRYANNNISVVWPTVGGETYSRISLSMDDVAVSTDGSFPEYTLALGEVDVNGALRTRIRETNGLVGATLRLMVVHSAHLDLTTPAVDELAEVLRCDVTADAVALHIGIPSLLNQRFPRDRYVPGYCRHKFKGALCQYTGDMAACNHSLEECRERNNSQNFGGSPGIVGGVYG